MVVEVESLRAVSVDLRNTGGLTPLSEARLTPKLECFLFRRKSLVKGI